jgi:hypothetical protein
MEAKTPRFRRRFVNVAKKASTALSQEQEVGVKWKVQCGRAGQLDGILSGGEQRRCDLGMGQAADAGEAERVSDGAPRSHGARDDRNPHPRPITKELLYDIVGGCYPGRGNTGFSGAGKRHPF